MEGRRKTVSEEILQEIVRRIVAAVRPDRIILFGSAARGKMGPNSDVDLLVHQKGQISPSPCDGKNIQEYVRCRPSGGCHCGHA